MSYKYAVGLGSNLGNRSLNISAAILKLKVKLKKVIVSRLYESPALVPPNSPQNWNIPYLNAVLTGETCEPPSELFLYLKIIEKELGRTDSPRWSPRIIDLDILMVQHESEFLKINTQTLQIPHPGVYERNFVIYPLSEIEPTWISFLPNQNKAANTEIKLHRFCGTQIMGIINVTPDSFSDGGTYRTDGGTYRTDDVESYAKKSIQSMIQNGAHILDLGAESTRPGSTQVSIQEELKRLIPMLELTKNVISKFKIRAQLSVDTRHPEVASYALKHGANIINDVTGFENEHMCKAASESNCDLVMMHSLGIPPSPKEVIPIDQNPISFLSMWAQKRIKDLKNEYGIDSSQIIFDPGIGFGKTPTQSLQILGGLDYFKNLGVRILIGHSRKSFLNLFTDKPFAERDFETNLISMGLIKNKPDYIRVHNVQALNQTLQIAESLENTGSHAHS